MRAELQSIHPLNSAAPRCRARRHSSCGSCGRHRCRRGRAVVTAGPPRPMSAALRASGCQSRSRHARSTCSLARERRQQNAPRAAIASVSSGCLPERRRTPVAVLESRPELLVHGARMTWKPAPATTAHALDDTATARASAHLIDRASDLAAASRESERRRCRNGCSDDGAGPATNSARSAERAEAPLTTSTGIFIPLRDASPTRHKTTPLNSTLPKRNRRIPVRQTCHMSRRNSAYGVRSGQTWVDVSAISSCRNRSPHPIDLKHERSRRKVHRLNQLSTMIRQVFVSDPSHSSDQSIQGNPRQLLSPLKLLDYWFDEGGVPHNWHASVPNCRWRPEQGLR